MTAKISTQHRGDQVHRRAPVEPPVSEAMLLDAGGLEIQGPVDQVLNAVGLGVRDALFLAGVRDYSTLAIKAVIRAHFRLESQGLIVRQVGRGDGQ